MHIYCSTVLGSLGLYPRFHIFDLRPFDDERETSMEPQRITTRCLLKNQKAQPTYIMWSFERKNHKC